MAIGAGHIQTLDQDYLCGIWLGFKLILTVFSMNKIHPYIEISIVM